LKDEIARLKNLPPRPPFKPSGMDKATQPRPAGPGRRPGRGAKRDRATREVTIRAEVSAGSRFKGYKTVVRRDLMLAAEVVRYKRERWLTPEGQTIIAPLPEGIAGGFGPGVRRFCLALHTQGQVTTERLTDLLNGIGLSISKRQVVRLLTSDLEPFEQEDRAILQAGLVSSPYLTVDDTGARHARRPGVTTQIGGERFCVFRTSRSKSRLNFLSLLRAGCDDYVVNEATLDYLRRQPVDGAVIARLRAPGQSVQFDLEWLAASGAVLDQHLRPASAAVAERSRHLGCAPAPRADGEHCRGLDDAGQFPGCPRTRCAGFMPSATSRS
jgi:hypothetical protein